MKVTWKQRVEYVALRGVMVGVNLLPERFAYSVFGALGRLFFSLSRRRRGYALHMLRNAYPEGCDRDLLRIGRLATGNMFKVALDVIRADPWLRSGRILERIDTSEFAACAAQAPFIGITAHLGSWEAGAIGMAAVVGGTHVVTKMHRNPLLRSWMTASRSKVGVHCYPRRGGIRGLIRALDRGQVALQAVDQNQRLRGMFVPFFGEIAATERAAATLAVRKGYPLQVGACHRIGGGFRFNIAVFPPIHPEITGDVEADVRTLVKQVNAQIEAPVLRYPEQYNWIHNRYRTQPKPGDLVG